MCIQSSSDDWFHLRSLTSAIPSTQQITQLCTARESWVPHISLVFREMWDTTAFHVRLSIWGQDPWKWSLVGDDFLAAVRADFRTHGAGVIAEVRADKPDQYLKIVLSVLPKDFDVTINQLDALSDEEIRSRIRHLEAVLKPFLQEPADRGEDGISGAAGGA